MSSEEVQVIGVSIEAGHPEQGVGVIGISNGKEGVAEVMDSSPPDNIPLTQNNRLGPRRVLL